MASIGSISLSTNNVIEAGLALLLVKPPEKQLEFTHRNAVFRVAPDTPFIVCCFSEANSHAEALDIGNNLIQEGLDLLSMTGQADLATKNANEEYVVWWKENEKRTVACATTVTFSFSVSPVELTAHDANGNIIPPNIIVPRHHLGFRFYRLAQVSDDLFDAFRNMYLAFEVLLSSQFPKGRGSEIKWLNDSLTAASTDLSLNTLVPAGTSSPVDHILNIIYEGARLPLFHAKDGRAYFAPINHTNDRKTVVSALSLLTIIVIRMAEVWFNARRIRGSVSLKILEKSSRTVFPTSEFVYSDNPQYSLKDDLDNKSIQDGYRFNAQLREEFFGEPKQHIYGCFNVAEISNRDKLFAIFLVNQKSQLIAFSPETSFDLSGFEIFEVLFFLRGNNASEPKSLFIR